VSTLTDLTPEQFQFVRALYIAIPPISRELPPGDHAIMASSGGAMMVALVSDGQACARFLAPDFIKTMLVEVGQGMTVGVGTPLLPSGLYSSVRKRSISTPLCGFIGCAIAGLFVIRVSIRPNERGRGGGVGGSATRACAPAWKASSDLPLRLQPTGCLPKVV
jgi:hypothetical protein